MLEQPKIFWKNKLESKKKNLLEKQIIFTKS